MDDSNEYLRYLCMPRWPAADLEEFKTQGAIDYFTRKKEDYVGPFSEHLANTAQLKEAAEKHLELLADIIESPDGVNGKLSEDDIHLYANLRSLSIVKDLKYPQKVEQYRQSMAQQSGVPLHDDIAL